MSKANKKSYISKTNNLYGIVLMLVNAGVIALLYTVMKELTKSMNSSHAVFFYKMSILCMISPWVFSRGIKAIYTSKLHLHVLRGLLSISGSLCFMKALEHVEMVDATALGYLEQVLVIVIGIVHFKERISFVKISCIIASFFGAIIVVYPDLVNFPDGSYVPLLFIERDFEFNSYYVFVLLSVLFWSFNCVVVKILGKSEKSKTQSFYVLLFSSIISYSVGFVKWHSVGLLYLPYEVIPISSVGLETKHLIYILILALCYFVHCIAFYKALSQADLAIVMPFDYTRLIFTGLLGFIVFAERPNQYSYWGYFLIMISGVLLMSSESRNRSKNRESQKLRKIEAESEHA